MSETVAALFVERNGVYWDLPGVDAWDEARDARLYAGPWPVVAHPPCQRWGSYWFGGPASPKRFKKGDDGGCFASALASVRRFGGVIEHPKGSHAWLAHGLVAPPIGGGWVMADFEGGWTCYVEQGHYGHSCRKPTWLYVHGSVPPPLKWFRAPASERMATTIRTVRCGEVALLSKRQRAETPTAFRDTLLSIARLAGAQAA